MSQSIDSQPFKAAIWWLEQWANWVKIGGNSSGYKSLLGSLLLKQSMRRLNCCITDDQAVHIDAQLAELKKRCPETASATIAYFLWECNTSAVAKKLDINRNKASALINSGIAWMDARIDFDESVFIA